MRHRNNVETLDKRHITVEDIGKDDHIAQFYKYTETIYGDGKHNNSVLP